MHVVVVALHPIHPSTDADLVHWRRENDLAMRASGHPGLPEAGAARRMPFSRSLATHRGTQTQVDRLEALGKAALRYYSSPSPFGRTGIPRRRSRLFLARLRLHLGASCRRRPAGVCWLASRAAGSAGCWVSARPAVFSATQQRDVASSSIISLAKGFVVVAIATPNARTGLDLSSQPRTPPQASPSCIGCRLACRADWGYLAKAVITEKGQGT